jgi:hypothetical protein
MGQSESRELDQFVGLRAVKNVSSTSEAQSLSDGGEAAAELVYVPERFCCGFEITRGLFEPTFAEARHGDHGPARW